MTTASISAPVNAVQIVQHNPAVGNSQQVKGLPTAMTVQQIQQAMKAMPQNLPVVGIISCLYILILINISVKTHWC